MVKMSMLVFWVVMSCGLVGRYQRFRGTYCWYLPTDPHSIVMQKTNIYNNFASFLYGYIMWYFTFKEEINYMVWEERTEENIWTQ
jgi:hypothetical protein